MVEAVVEFEYKALEEDELSLTVGDVVQEVIKHDGGWWEGSIDGKRGMFPDNFVQEIIEEKPKERPAPSTRKAGGSGGGGHVAELANRLHKDGGIKMGPPVKPKKEAPQKKVTAVATFSYIPDNDDELKLEEGDVVEVLKQDDGGWWFGSLNGQQGMFPSNFVELVPPGDQVEEEPAEIKGHKVRGFGMGDIFSGGPIKLRKADAAGGAPKKEVTQGHKQAPAPTQDNKPTRPVSHAPGASVPAGAPARPTPHKDNKTERGRVVFTYGAEAPDELSLQEGEVITILDKNLPDKGWWRGEANGKQGIFPESFVELISAEPTSKPRKPPPPPGSPLTKDRAELPPPPSPKQQPPEKKSDSTKPARPTSGVPPPVRRKDTGHTEDHKAQNGEQQASGGKSKPPMRKPPPVDYHNTTEPPTSPPPGTGVHREDKKVPTHAVQPQSTHRDEPHSPRSAPGSPRTSSVGSTTIDPAIVESLRKEMSQLRANSVSREQHEQLQKEVHALKESQEQLKTTTNKRVYELMAEVDEEKKVRLNMEVEIERLKKLVLP